MHAPLSVRGTTIACVRPDANSCLHTCAWEGNWLGVAHVLRQKFPGQWTQCKLAHHQSFLQSARHRQCSHRRAVVLRRPFHTT